ncbi:MAG TPA: protein tyrosine kinase [Parvularcula sp.]|nr:protein tyrosine kinase [Parvularcula sp.]HBS31856.1 protein tyrosine kinase [Parvularcula sp.]
MDRIREAVTKARKDRVSAGTPAAGASPLQRFQHSPHRPAEAFAEVACDFDRFAEHRIISNEQDPVLNAYRVLRTRVLQKMEEKNWRTLAVISPGSGAGKTVTAINLAIAVGSKQGSRATLVDLDFYRPRVAEYLGVRNAPSILDYFEGAASLSDVTVKPDLPDVLLIANERVSRRGAEHLTSAKADELIARTINDFGSRIVIFDMSPMLGCDDTIAFLPKVDCVLLVVASGQSREPEIRESIRLLNGVNVVGTVLNKAPPEAMIGAQYY